MFCFEGRRLLLQFGHMLLDPSGSTALVLNSSPNTKVVYLVPSLKLFLCRSWSASWRSPSCSPEMEVTEIILAKIYRICHLSSHSRGYFARVLIFKSIQGKAFGFLWITRHHPMIQICFRRYRQFFINSVKSISAIISQWIFSRKKSENQKSRDFSQIFVISNSLGLGFKNLWKIYRLAYGFLFFVISLSEQIRQTIQDKGEVARATDLGVVGGLHASLDPQHFPQCVLVSVLHL